MNNLEKIEIREGLIGSSYFRIMPIRIIDINKDTDDMDNIDGYEEFSISIEEDHVEAFLYPLLLKYFNNELLENVNRGIDDGDTDLGFGWYLTYNYYTIDTIQNMIEELKEIMKMLSDDYENKKLDYIKVGFDWVLYFDKNFDIKNLAKDKNERLELVKNYVDVINNFYERFIKYMEIMIEEGTKKGYKLISFEGP